VTHPQTYGGRITNAPTSFLFCNEAASYGAKDTDSSSSFSVADNDGKRQTIPLDTSSLFLIWNEAAAIATAKSEEEDKKQPPKGSVCQREAASRGSCTGSRTGRERERERGALALLRQTARAAEAAKAAEPAEGPDTDWLDSWTNMGVAIYERNNQLLVPGRKQGIVTEEDPAAVADGAAAKPMSEQMELALQPPKNTQSSQSA
jgi:hypothetical protein